jgi:serine/threonine protein kinase
MLSSENQSNHANKTSSSSSSSATSSKPTSSGKSENLLKKPMKKKRKKNEKHNSVVPDLIEERHRGSDKVDKYTKGRYLGKGGFARCYTLTSLTTGNVYAGKVVAKSSLKKEKAQQKLVAEIKIHQHLHHQNIVRFYHSFQDRHNVYILLELCTNQSLMELLKCRKRLTEPETRFYMLQIIDAVEYLHRNNVIHRDLKLGNLFLNSQLQVKVGDMGLSTKLEKADDRKKTICGTPNYIAPEIITGGTHSFEVDIWSLGVILYTMLVGKPPFETRDVKATYKRIKRGSYSFPDTVDLSKDSRTLIESLLQLVPEKRPSLTQIKNSNFFTRTGAYTPKLGELTVSSLKKVPTFDPAVIQAQMEAKEKAKAFAAATLVQSQQPPRAPSTYHRGVAAPEMNSGPSTATTATARSQWKPPTTASISSSTTSSSNIAAFTTSSTSTANSTTTNNQKQQMHRYQHKKSPTSLSDMESRGNLAYHGTHSPAVDALLDMESRAKHRNGFHASSSERLAGLTKQMERLEMRNGGSSSTTSSSISNSTTTVTTTSTGSRRHHHHHQHHDTKGTSSDTASSIASSIAPLRSSIGSSVSGSSLTTRSGDRNERNNERNRSSSSSNNVLRSSSGKMSTLKAMHREISRSLLIEADGMEEEEQVSGGSTARSSREFHRRRRGGMNGTNGTNGTNGISANDERCNGNLPFDEDTIVPPKTWVVRHVDYTRKYGFGYLLSNGAVGVYFNDSTKIILSSDDSNFEYIERIKCNGGSSALPERHSHTLSNYPDSLKKKVTLLVHFKAHLCNNNNNSSNKKDDGSATTTTSGASISVNVPTGEKSVADPNGIAAGGNGMTYVKKWVRTNRCLLFRLSDRSVQVAFFDNTEIILSQDADIITLTYLNKEKVRTSYSLQGVMDSSKSHILKRLRYCKLVIHELLSGKLSHHSTKSSKTSSGTSSTSSKTSSKTSSNSSTKRTSSKHTSSGRQQ